MTQTQLTKGAGAGDRLDSPSLRWSTVMPIIRALWECGDLQQTARRELHAGSKPRSISISFTTWNTTQAKVHYISRVQSESAKMKFGNAAWCLRRTPDRGAGGEEYGRGTGGKENGGRRGNTSLAARPPSLLISSLEALSNKDITKALSFSEKCVLD